MVGSTSFLSSSFKIQYLQIRKKIGVKSRKNIWTKLLPPPFLVFFFFFFLLFLSNVGLLFLFSLLLYFFWLFLCDVGFLFFVFVFFGFVRWWVLLLFLLFFFLIFIFIIFLRKQFSKISYAIFWNIHFHLYTIFFKRIMYYFLFYLRGTWW